MSIRCKSCGSDKLVKNGFVYGVQRYKCKECFSNFIDRDKRKNYNLWSRLKVLKLYLENRGIRTIERLTGIRNSQISSWIEEAAEDIKQELAIRGNNISFLKDISILEIDELCTYIKKTKKWGRAYLRMDCC